MKSETLASRLIFPEVRRIVEAIGSRGRDLGDTTRRRCDLTEDLIVTNLAVIEVTDEGLALREVAPGINANEVKAVTAARLAKNDAKIMDL